MAAKRENESGGGKMRGRLLILVAAFVLAAVGLFFFLKPRAEAPPPPPEEIIRRKFRSSFNPEESTLARLSRMRQELAADKRISSDTRHQVLVESLAESVNDSFSDFAKLPEEQKTARAKLLCEDAVRAKAFYRVLAKDKRREATDRIANTPGGRAQLARTADIIAHELSPRDREMLGPAIRTWQEMLKGK